MLVGERVGGGPCFPFAGRLGSAAAARRWCGDRRAPGRCGPSAGRTARRAGSCRAGQCPGGRRAGRRRVVRCCGRQWVGRGIGGRVADAVLGPLAGRRRRPATTRRSRRRRSGRVRGSRGPPVRAAADLIRSSPSCHAPARCRCGRALRRLTAIELEGARPGAVLVVQVRTSRSVVAAVLPSDDRGRGVRPGARGSHSRQQPSGRRRLVPPAIAVPRRITFLAKREYFTQPGFVGRLEEDLLHRGGPGADRPVERVRPHRRRWPRPCGSCARAACWASTPRAPARRTDGCTRARPVWRAWRWRQACRSSPSR